MAAALLRSAFPASLACFILISLAAPNLLAYLLPLTCLMAMTVAHWQGFTDPKKSAFVTAVTSPYVQLALVTSLAMIMSCIYSIQPEHSLHQALEASFALTSFAMLWSLPLSKNFRLDKQSQKWLFGFYMLLIASLIIMALLNLADLIKSAPPITEQQAVFLAIFCWPLSLYLTSKSQNARRLILFGLTGLALFISRHEIGLLIFLLSASLYLVVRTARLKSLPASILLGSALLTISLLPIIIALSRSTRIPAIISEALPVTFSKSALWQATLETLRQQMPFGTGIDTSRFVIPTGDLVTQASQQLHPQNYVLELGLELGLLGMILAILAIFAACLLFYHTPAAIRPFTGASLMAAATLYSLAFSVWHEWRSTFIAFIMLLLFRFSRNREREKKSQKPGWRSAI